MTEDFTSSFEKYLEATGDTFVVSGLALLLLLKEEMHMNDAQIASFCQLVCGCPECRAWRLRDGRKA